MVNLYEMHNRDRRDVVRFGSNHKTTSIDTLLLNRYIIPFVMVWGVDLVFDWLSIGQSK